MPQCCSRKCLNTSSWALVIFTRCNFSIFFCLNSKNVKLTPFLTKNLRKPKETMCCGFTNLGSQLSPVSWVLSQWKSLGSPQFEGKPQFQGSHLTCYWVLRHSQNIQCSPWQILVAQHTHRRTQDHIHMHHVCPDRSSTYLTCRWTSTIMSRCIYVIYYTLSMCRLESTLANLYSSWGHHIAAVSDCVIALYYCFNWNIS